MELGSILLPKAANSRIVRDIFLFVVSLSVSITSAYFWPASVVDRSERVIASNVFEETDFPTMSKGRVALLGDGKLFWFCPLTPLMMVLNHVSSAAHSMTSFFGQVSFLDESSLQQLLLTRCLRYQGACQAIEDATELANSLQSYFSTVGNKEQDHGSTSSRADTSNLVQVLSDYSARRGDRAKALVSFSRNYAKVHTGTLAYGMGPLVRKLIYAYLPEWGWMWALRWLYGYQPIVDSVSHCSIPSKLSTY